MPSNAGPGQQAMPSPSKAIPVTRAAGMETPEISAPNSSRTTRMGTAINPSPVASSMIAARLSKRFMVLGAKARQFFRCACLTNDWLVCGFGDSVCCGPLLRRRHLRRTEFEGQLIDCAREAEWEFVALIHSGAGVQANVEGFVNGHDQRNRVRDRLLRQLPTVHREHASTALAGAGAVVFEFEHECVLARRERTADRKSGG